jgi:AraC family transcriptional regulator
MNFYVGLITGAVNFVESNIQEPLSLEDIAQEFNFSAFHFNRIFSTVTGKTLKQYVLGRKLSLAMARLKVNNEPIISIAYDFGFHSPEVFSRAFKKQFGVSPNEFRQDRPCIEPIEKVTIVERDIINFQGKLALKGSVHHLEAFELKGIETRIDVNQPGFEKVLQNISDTYTLEARKTGRYHTDQLYALVNCLGEDNGEYEVFYGMKPISPDPCGTSLTRMVPQGWYEKFVYTGDMFDIRSSFVNDLYRWVMIHEIELESNGIGMINIFKDDYPDTHDVEILVPIKSPK